MSLISCGVSLDKPAKIMVRATNWVGDAIISLPAIELLRDRYPEAEIVVVAKPWVAELYSNHPTNIRLIVYDPGGEHQGRSGFAALIENLRRERFDAAVLLQHAFHAAWMAWRARVPVRIGYRTQGRGPLLTEAVQLPPRAYLGHQSSEYLELLFLSGLVDERPPSARAIHLEVTKAEKRWAAEALKGLGLEGPRCFVGLNPGAAFSLFVDSPSPNRTRWLLTSFSIVAVIIVLVLILKMGRRFTATTIALALILGGAIGNVWDRIHYGVVTDFLEVFLRWGHWSYHWPDFNVADSAIVCGGILIVLDALLPKRSQP